MHEHGVMKPLEKLIPFDEAKRLLWAAVPATSDSEPAPLIHCVGRILREDMRATIDVPGFDRSAMDGYAVRASDTARAPATLRMVETLHAGMGSSTALGPGECAQIATGASLPAGADAVVMVETTSRDGHLVRVARGVASGENVTRRGSDLRIGDVAVAAGSLLTPARLAALASLGHLHALVPRRPRVGLVSTGTELREPGTHLGPGQIHDSNSPALQSLLESHGVVVERTGIVPDERDALRAALARFDDVDLILLTGSSSAGERDYLASILAEEGSIDFHGVRVRPGKPLLLGRHRRTPVLGLAGNPASCLTMAYALVVPLLRRFQGLDESWQRVVRARLATPVRSPEGRRHFLPVRVRDGRAEPTYRESDHTTSLSRADGLVEIPEDVESLASGDAVEVRLF